METEYCIECAKELLDPYDRFKDEDGMRCEKCHTGLAERSKDV